MVLEDVHRIAIGQLNTTVGDLEGNCRKILEYTKMARSLDVDIVVFPELVIPGCPPGSLIHRPKFIDDNIMALKMLSKDIPDIVTIVGFADRQDSILYSAASVMYGGEIKGICRSKVLQPIYPLPFKKDCVESNIDNPVFYYRDMPFSLQVIYDLWQDDTIQDTYLPCRPGFMIYLCSSPYHMGKADQREDAIIRLSRKEGCYAGYVNLVGGQDGLVFDGRSFFVDKNGNILCRAMSFKEDLLVVDIPKDDICAEGAMDLYGEAIKISDGIKRDKRLNLLQIERPCISNPVEEVYKALVLGLGDYVSKNGFEKAVLGISGGIDSALVAAIAADSLGSDNVTGIFMPSPYTSEESKKDAIGLAENLGIKLIEVPIEDIYNVYLNTLRPFFKGLNEDITEENIQARIRGNILMAFSNKFRWLVLTTGNKSEMSVGYATLYGDMAGGLAVIKDVPKTFVYRLCEYRNSLGAVIPENILKKEPTAELRANQKDTDTLPPYERLDKILRLYLEDGLSWDDIILQGMDKEEVERVIRMVKISEYKRRQSPPGIKVTPKALGLDFDMPVTNRYSG
ncbi:MAG TPA: NAD+ synthase [Syntrophorhabdaceae bacterium]|nr:NAD+ synthase [Syntrophorhabdaceae bacterium]